MHTHKRILIIFGAAFLAAAGTLLLLGLPALSRAEGLGGPAVLAAIIGITARRRTEEALRESEKNLRQAQRIAHLGSWALDLETNEFVVSEEVVRIYKYEDRLQALSVWRSSPNRSTQTIGNV